MVPRPTASFKTTLAYAKWYATWWALRMMDVVDKYQPDFIYTDGFSSQPFSGFGTGIGYKCDAMQRVIADFYNKTLQRRGKVDVFSIVKFRGKTNGTVNTAEADIPKDIKSDQDWIAETPVGDWFYAPGFTNDSGAVIHNLLEEVSRDGNIGVCICPHPDGSLDDSTVKMLKEIGEWMRINGAGIYGSKAWTRLGEGADGKLNVLPGGKLGRDQADHRFCRFRLPLHRRQRRQPLRLLHDRARHRHPVAHHLAGLHGQRPRQADQVRHPPRLQRSAHVETGHPTPSSSPCPTPPPSRPRSASKSQRNKARLSAHSVIPCVFSPSCSPPPPCWHPWRRPPNSA